AEDGIRDGHVTGVQTCALPISLKRNALAGDRWCQLNILDRQIRGKPERERRSFAHFALHRKIAAHQSCQAPADGETKSASLASEIGRASCRERVYSSFVAVQAE